VLWEKQTECSLEEKVLKRERGASEVRSLKAPGENTWTFRNTTACLGTELWVYNMPDYKEHFEGHLVLGQAVH
jgi:hypothetical protein